MRPMIRTTIATICILPLLFGCDDKSEISGVVPDALPLPAATKEKPFVNSLGMRFVPVPIKGGQSVLFSVWETRVKDYAAFAAENADVDTEWKDVSYEGHKQNEDHPVVKVSWEDAQKFCQWLSQKEGRTYRLPTDHEWLGLPAPFG